MEQSKKKRTSLSITNECDRLIEEIARMKGISRNSVIELAVRLLAQKSNIPIQPVDRSQDEE